MKHRPVFCYNLTINEIYQYVKQSGYVEKINLNNVMSNINSASWENLGQILNDINSADGNYACVYVCGVVSYNKYIYLIRGYASGYLDDIVVIDVSKNDSVIFDSNFLFQMYGTVSILPDDKIWLLIRILFKYFTKYYR